MPIFLFILLLLVATSCSTRSGQEIDSRLTSAERLMEEHPDSALAILNDISHPLHGSNDSLSLNSEHREALYALLLTQARHKNYIDETNDSLISTAVSYFDRNDDAPRLMKSLFYHATVNSNDKNYPPAMTSAMRALQLANDLDDIYWQARISELIGHIFSETYFFEEAAEYYIHAAELYQMINLERGYLYAYCDLAVQYSNLLEYDKSLKLVDSIMCLTSDPAIHSYCADIALPILTSLNKSKEAERFADTIIKHQNLIPLACKDYLYISELKFKLNKIDEASEFLNLAKKSVSNISDSLALQTVLANRYLDENNFPQASESLRELIKLQNSIASDIKQQSCVIAQRDYYSQQAVTAELRATKRLNMIIILCTGGIIFIGFLYSISRYKIHRRDTRINEYMAEILYLTSQRDEYSEKIDTLSHSISSNKSAIDILKEDLDSTHKKNEALRALSQNLFHDRLEHLNMLINEFYEADGSKETQHAIYKNVTQEIRKFTSPKNLSEIENVVNSCFDNVISKMRVQLPHLSSDDINFITLTLAGYSAKAISLFTGVKPNSTYTKKKRLITKISESDAPDKEWFISQMRNPLIV